MNQQATIMAEPVDIAEKMALITEHWRPRVAAEFTGQELRIVKVQGDFPWHFHEDYDEVFIGWKGEVRVEFRDRTVTVRPGQVFVVPRGIEHRTVADSEAEVLFIAAIGARNTGNVDDHIYTAPTGVRA
ncbi:cupin domain-containing protein [Devosia ginsengisoli]|uniref:cupin domain-containing protein n=1 Tax=Devosia ginsengisoli TaxID=400770 RepID=UPI0026E9F8BA|nr:cupin domain-containing protein [Devosia ginsengisoli]MCR6672676.1 cupin domain-containing protein [Devosia ginsengisoli]